MVIERGDKIKGLATALNMQLDVTCLVFNIRRIQGEGEININMLGIDVSLPMRVVGSIYDEGQDSYLVLVKVGEGPLHIVVINDTKYNLLWAGFCEGPITIDRINYWSRAKVFRELSHVCSSLFTYDLCREDGWVEVEDGIVKLLKYTKIRDEGMGGSKWGTSATSMEDVFGLTC